MKYEFIKIHFLSCLICDHSVSADDGHQCESSRSARDRQEGPQVWRGGSGGRGGALPGLPAQHRAAGAPRERARGRTAAQARGERRGREALAEALRRVGGQVYTCILVWFVCLCLCVSLSVSISICLCLSVGFWD